MKKKPVDTAETLLNLVCKKGPKGLWENEALTDLPLDKTALQAVAQKLEEEGKLRILLFSPLFLVSGDSADFLGQKVLSYLAHFHKKHPKERGVSLDRLKKRFVVPEKMLLLTLKTLVRDGRLRQEGSVFALAGFERRLPEREEQLLLRLEETYFHGDPRVVSLKEVQESFPVSPLKLESMLDILIGREKIVRGKEGFYLQSRWLDEIVGKVRSLGKKDLTVADFKAMTGLSRKFAIPLLELLDEMGVTRRKGSSREIL